MLNVYYLVIRIPWFKIIIFDNSINKSSFINITYPIFIYNKILNNKMSILPFHENQLIQIDFKLII